MILLSCVCIWHAVAPILVSHSDDMAALVSFCILYFCLNLIFCLVVFFNVSHNSCYIDTTNLMAVGWRRSVATGLLLVVILYKIVLTV